MKYTLAFTFDEWMNLRRKNQSSGKDQMIAWLNLHDENCSFEVDGDGIKVIFSNRAKAAMFKLTFMGTK